MNGREMFEEIDAHLLSDQRPSLYLERLDDPLFQREHPFRMLSRLRKVEQSPQHHPEGSVWNHTLLVVDQAAERKAQSSDSRAFMWAALLHDIGKAETTKIRKGKITAYDHDKVGAEMTRDFLAEFETEPFLSKVAALVRWHMQILYVVKDLPFADIHAMRLAVDVKDIALLGLCDRLGRRGADIAAEEQAIELFLKKVASAKP